MRAFLAAAAVGMLALAACSREAPSINSPAMTEAAVSSDSGFVAPQAADARGGEAMSDAPAASPPAPPGEPSGPVAGAAPMLAYIYGVSLELPLRSVRPMMGAHEEACRKAGPNVCQVINSSVNAQGEDSMYGNITLRAAPRWLETFRGGLEGQAREAGGRLREQSVTSEDLTRQIVDTNARLTAQKTLRERLQQILRTRPGKLQELLETERELARVQGEIDSAESQLAVMRERVNMSILNLSYASKATVVGGSVFEPVGDAFNQFFRIVFEGFAFIIRLVAVAIPVGVVLVPLGWLFLRWRRRRAAKKAAG